MSNARNLARLTPDSTGVLPVGNIATIPTTKLSGILPDSNAPSGSIIQVAQTVISAASTLNAAGGSTAVSGYNCTITPISTTSKIWIVMHLHYASSGTTYGGWFKRNGVDIGLGDAGSGQQRVSMGMALATDTNQSNTFIYSYLDSPSTTSALTYQFWVSNDNSVTLYLNRSQNDYANSTGKRGITTITLLEVNG